jgi:hypothetical protein
MFVVDVDPTTALYEMPTRVHKNGYCWDFADGHAESYTLRDRNTINWNPLDAVPNIEDTTWTGSPYPGLNPDWCILAKYATTTASGLTPK